MAELDKKFRRPESASRRLLLYIFLIMGTLTLFVVAKFLVTGTW